MLHNCLRQAAGRAEPSRPPTTPRSLRLAGGTDSRALSHKAVTGLGFVSGRPALRVVTMNVGGEV